MFRNITLLFSIAVLAGCGGSSVAINSSSAANSTVAGAPTPVGEMSSTQIDVNQPGDVNQPSDANMTAPGSVANKLAKQKEQANAPVTSGPAPLSSFTPAGEDSEISTTMRSDGSIFEVRRFKSHPQLKSAESTWKLGEPKRVEGLPHEKFYNFAYSKDGKWFAFVRGQEIRDVVMISNSKD